MMRKVRNSSKSGGSGSSSGKNGSKGQQQQQQQQPVDWDESGGAGGENSPRSDGTDKGDRENDIIAVSDKSVAGLQSKNYKLAKELSEVRVRHREEGKNVTRLTMENMNLASRCREAITQAATLKKELSLQKKKTAEAVAQTVAVIEQLKKMQKQQKQSAQRNTTTSADKPSSTKPAVVSPEQQPQPQHATKAAAEEGSSSPTESMTHSESSDADEIVVETPPVAAKSATVANNDNDDSESSENLNEPAAAAVTPAAAVSKADPTQSSVDDDTAKKTPPPLVTPSAVENLAVPVRETKGLTADDIMKEMDAEDALGLNQFDDDGEDDDIVEVSAETLDEIDLVAEVNPPERKEDKWLSAVNAAVTDAKNSSPAPVDPAGATSGIGLVSSDDFEEDGSSLGPMEIAATESSEKDGDSDSGDDSTRAVKEGKVNGGDSTRAVKESKSSMNYESTRAVKEITTGGDSKKSAVKESKTVSSLLAKEKEQHSGSGSPLKKALSWLPKKEKSGKEFASPKKERRSSRDTAPIDPPARENTQASVPLTVKNEDDRTSVDPVAKSSATVPSKQEKLSTFDPVVEASKRPVSLTDELANMVRESKTDDLWREDFDEAAETEDIITSLHSESPIKKSYFPSTASPKIQRFHPNSKTSSRLGSAFNEEMPSDMIQQPLLSHRSGGGKRLGSFQEEGNEGPKSSNLLSSIDAFEASFNISFPDSFAPKERTVPVEKKLPSTSTLAEEANDISIYNPFDTESPSKERLLANKTDGSDEPSGSPDSKTDKWGMRRVKDRVAYLRANSRSRKRSSEGELSPKESYPGETEEPLSPTESIVSITRSPEKKMETSPSLSASTYRRIRGSFTADKSGSKPDSPPPSPDVGYEKFSPVATPTKTTPVSIGQDRFSTPMDSATVPSRPEKSIGYDEARNRYETALGQRSSEKTSSGRRSSSSKSNSDRSSRRTTWTATSESSASKSNDPLRRSASVSSVRERAALFSGQSESKGPSPRSSWDEGDIPMRSSLSPPSKQRPDMKVEVPQPRDLSAPLTSVSTTTAPVNSAPQSNGVRPWRQQKQISPTNSDNQSDECLPAAPATSSSSRFSTNVGKRRHSGRPDSDLGATPIQQGGGHPRQQQHRHSINREV